MTSARREFLRFLAASPLAALPQDPTAKDTLSVLDGNEQTGPLVAALQ